MSAGEFSAEVVEVIWTRDGGCCAMCGRSLLATRRGYPAYEGGWSVQHREARGAGGVKSRKGRVRRPWLVLPSNGALMCGDGVSGCHGDVETRERAEGRRLGFVVSANGVRRPSEVPVRHAVHGWVLLDDVGGWSVVDEPEEAAA